MKVASWRRHWNKIARNVYSQNPTILEHIQAGLFIKIAAIPQSSEINMIAATKGCKYYWEVKRLHTYKSRPNLIAFVLHLHTYIDISDIIKW